jgi:hypothetical protein
LRPLGDAFVRRGSAPGQLGIGDHEDRTGGDLENRAGRIGFGDVRLDDIAVIAFRAQHGDGLVAGVAGPAAGFGATARRLLGFGHGALDRLAQRAVLDAGDGGRGLGRIGMAGDHQGRRGHAKGKSLTHQAF